jgi:hypothetical protein
VNHQAPFSLSWLVNLNLTQVPHEALCAIETAVLEEKRRRRAGLSGANLYRRRSTEQERLKKDYRHMLRRDPDEEEIEAAWVAHFTAVMSDDWSKYFVDTGGDSDYYVYLHFDPRVDRQINLVSSQLSVSVQGEPFYVGKGTGLRAYDLKRNEGHGVMLRQMRQQGLMAEDVVRIVAHGLTEAKALELESKLIHFFGSRFDSGNPGMLVNLATTAGPTLKPQKPFQLRANK